MGGSSSKTVLNQLTQSINNIAVNSVLDCQTSSTQDQSTVVNNSGLLLWGTYKMKQTSDINVSCMQDSKRITKLQNDIINNIKQASTAEGQSILGAFGSSSSSANTNLTMIIQNSVTSSNLQKNYTTIKQNQKISFTNSGVIGYIQSDLTQGATIFAAATLKSLDDAGVFNKIGSYVDQSSTAKGGSLFDFGSLFSGNISSYVMIFLLAIILFVVYRVYSGGMSKKPSQNPGTSTTPQAVAPA